MIFVTVGNATQGFSRLLACVENLSSNGVLSEERVVVQRGSNADFKSLRCEHVDFLVMEEFQALLGAADIVISHGGVGTLLSALKLGKIPVVMPRQKRYGEAVNDHQVQIVRALAQEGRVIPAYEPEEIPAAISQARQHTSGTRLAAEPIIISMVQEAFGDLTK